MKNKRILREVIALRAVTGIGRKLKKVISTFEMEGGDVPYILGKLSKSSFDDNEEVKICNFKWDVIGILASFEELNEFNYLEECMDTIEDYIVESSVNTTEDFNDKSQLIKLLAEAREASFYIYCLSSLIDNSNID